MAYKIISMSVSCYMLWRIISKHLIKSLLCYLHDNMNYPSKLFVCAIYSYMRLSQLCMLSMV